MPKNPHAQALGRLGGLKGGPARYNALTKKELHDAARKAGIASGAARRKLIADKAGVSRQRLYQRARKAEGLCIICAKPRVGKNRSYCEKHRLASIRYVQARNKITKKHIRAIRPAHTAVAIALRNGRLVRPASCSRCGKKDPKLNAHHEDYKKPLAVVWLCYPCHHRAHGRK